MIDMDFLTGLFIPVVIAICLGVGWLIKHTIPNKKVNRFIPLIVGVLGTILGVVFYKAITLDAIAAGLISGIASVGFHQLIYQLIKEKDE
jgi:uncharacterized membrane protein